jgi:hypothetical protein
MTAQGDPWLGNWKINLEKSVYNPGPKPTIASIFTLASWPDGVKTTIDAVYPNGQKFHEEWVVKFDGKDSPITGAPIANLMINAKRIDARTYESVEKVDGEVFGTWTVRVSSDGKTLTMTQNGFDGQRKQVSNVLVADRLML